MEAVETLIKKDMLDPMNGAKLTENDIIPLQRVRCVATHHALVSHRCLITEWSCDIAV